MSITVQFRTNPVALPNPHQLRQNAATPAINHRSSRQSVERFGLDAQTVITVASGTTLLVAAPFAYSKAKRDIKAIIKWFKDRNNRPPGSGGGGGRHMEYQYRPVPIDPDIRRRK